MPESETVVAADLATGDRGLRRPAIPKWLSLETRAIIAGEIRHH
jgi:hypothetical protein